MRPGTKKLFIGWTRVWGLIKVTNARRGRFCRRKNRGIFWESGRATRLTRMGKLMGTRELDITKKKYAGDTGQGRFLELKKRWSYNENS